MSHIPKYDDRTQAEYSSKFPVTRLTARVITLASLIVSLAVLKTNDVTFDNGYVLTYKDFRSYKYMFYVMIIGIIYTLLQIPFAIYYMKTKKHLINHYGFLKFEFYADKLVTLFLATGAGAAFGATLDMKKYVLDSESKVQDYLTMVYIPAAFLVVGCIGCGISSVHSSLALTNIS
ncbi:hypothetical protein BUALT_Bualt05G0099600 [Buddleja alternifolia]|uniref:CASP-like protein n=1 Tax=Buddleja alternifolia TaxID=168488 RepID=A0AAV6XRG4_9LAMI|nr:hypothetical protein BUALT_Bualt05G0099600 [Buddleja alternifolia]